jgi:hypothetical protein
MRVLKALTAVAIVSLIMALSASALTVIDNMDNGSPYSARTEKKDMIEGAGAVSSSGTGGTIVLQRTLKPTVDISEYRGTGYARLYLYIESVENMSDTAGQLELTSSGICDNEETSWNISKNMLKDGWNTLYLSFESPGENAANLSAINYVRVYIHITGKNKVMLDELAVGTEDELGITPAAVETSAPVKLPAEVYGEGGAVAAALAAAGAAETAQSDAEAPQTETNAAGDTESGAEAKDADGTETAQVNYTAAAAIAGAIVVCCAVAIAVVVYIVKRGKK